MIEKLELKNVSKVKNNTHILKDVSIVFYKGEITGVIGKNGSGKSSLFKLISGLWDASSGKILINDLELGKCKISSIYNVSSFIESPNVYENLKVKDNFEILLSLYEVKNLDWFNYLYKEFKISEFENKKLKKCSSGMRQKVGLIMSLLNDGDLVILDEPTNALDIESVNTLYNIIQILKSKNKIIILSSHIIDELDSIIDKGIILDSGCIKENYSKSRDNLYYKIEFFDCESMDKVTNIFASYTMKKINNNCICIKMQDLNIFMKQCYENNISIKNINKEDSILKSLFERKG